MTREKIYIAGASSERLAVRQLIEAVETLGYEITHDWTKSEGYTTAVSDACYRQYAENDLDAVRACDILWYVAPHDKSEGSSSELGAALVLDKITLVSGSMRYALGRIFPRLADLTFEQHAEVLEFLRRRPTLEAAARVRAARPWMGDPLPPSDAPSERRVVLCSRGCCFECDDCSRQPGSPRLCDDCLARRAACAAPLIVVDCVDVIRVNQSAAENDQDEDCYCTSSSAIDCGENKGGLGAEDCTCVLCHGPSSL